MSEHERAKVLSEKIDFSDWEWLPEEVTIALSERAARAVIQNLIEEGAFVTWDEGDLIGVMIGPFLIKFAKSDLDREEEGTEDFVGRVKIELSGEWQ